MSLETKLNQDLKTAMLARDEQTVGVLRMLKSTLLYAKVASGEDDRDKELPDDKVLDILTKEAKKRQESADLYVQGGNQAKADAELSEKAIIEAYLPAQLSESEVNQLIDGAIDKLGATDMSSMGQVIGAVKSEAGATADGALVARLVKQRLSA